jgi:hypothetical protein
MKKGKRKVSSLRKLAGVVVAVVVVVYCST